MRPGYFTLRLPFMPIAVGLSYFMLAAAAIAMTRLGGGIALMWLANAPLIAALCVADWRRWPAIVVGGYVGAIMASVLVSPVPFASPFFAAATVGEGVLAAYLLLRWGVAESRLDSIRSIALFVAGAGVVAPLVSGVAGALIGSILFPLQFFPALFDWTLGHSIGTLVATPLALQLTRRDIDWPLFEAHHGISKAIGAAALLIGVVTAVFSQTTLPLLFLPIVPLLIATFTFQRFGGAVGIVIVALIGGVLTVHGTGPMSLIHGDQAYRLQFFQFYLAVLIVTVLPVAATLVQRDRLLAALQESEARYRLLSDHTTDIMLTLDPDGTIRFASEAIRELGHFDPAVLIGRNAMSLIVPAGRTQARDAHINAVADPEQTFTAEFEAIRADGSTGWFEANTRAVRGLNGSVSAVVSTIRDLNGRKAREAELQRAANTDPLTGLLNRAAFRARVAEAQASHAQSVLALLDLDHFKLINDAHGHATGDAALLMLADLLRENLRPQDAVGRIGGEEFAILLADMTMASARAVCERLRIALGNSSISTAAGGLAAITTSIGLSLIDENMPIERAFREADLALYAAKAKGRNRTEVSAG